MLPPPLPPTKEATGQLFGKTIFIWIIGALSFVAIVGVSFSIVGQFVPRGDGSLAFVFGLIPSEIATIVGFVVLSVWALSSRRLNIEPFAQRLKFYVFRFIAAGFIAGALMAINFGVVHLMCFVH
jgi:hypothetical protein